MDLLTVYKHHSELEAITTPPLISTIHKSPQHPLSPFQPDVSSPGVPWQRLLTVEILHFHALRFYLHSLPWKTQVCLAVAPSLLNLPCRAQLSTDRVRVRVTLRLAVYRQSSFFGAKPLETHDQYVFSTEYLRS
jgi:hypothetical protein